MTLTTTGGRHHGSPYQPALDGVRAVSVTLVLLFHAGFDWMSGGYLGVSVFFTLSGFLITGLLLTEHERTGGIGLGRFYGRRVARLGPASLLCILAVVVARGLGAFETVPHLHRDVLGALLQVYNWTELAGSGSYGDLFDGGRFHVTSPLEHHWSLAIEEQFYWLWPIALGLVLRRAGGARSPLVPVLATTAVFALAAPAIAILAGPDAAYWATPARLAEILVGACLACWLRVRPGVPAGVRRAGPLAGAVILISAITLPSGSGPAYQGALPLLALLSATVIWALQAEGALRRALAASVLPAIGRISYGLYLFHWPVFVLLRERGWDLASAVGFLTAVALTTSAAVVSSRLVEMPIRRGGWRPSRVLGWTGVATLTTATLVAVALPDPSPLIEEDTELLAAAAIDPVDHLQPLVPLRPSSRVATTTTTPETTTTTETTTATPETTTTTPETTTTTTTTSPALPTTSPTVVPLQVALADAPPRPVRILVVGDSTAYYLAEGLARWSLAHPEHAEVSALWRQGLGFVIDGTITSFEASVFVAGSRDVLEEDLPRALRDLRPDVVVLMTTVNDVASREWQGDEGSLDPTDPRFRERLADSYRSVTDRILELGAGHVAWVVPPTPTARWEDDPGMRDPARWAAQHDVIRSVAAQHPGSVSTIDLEAWFAGRGSDADGGIFVADGVHLTGGAALAAAEQFVGPSVVQRALGA